MSDTITVNVRIATKGEKSWGVCAADAGREAPLVWFPFSQIDDDRARVGYTGPLEVPEWLAEDRNLAGATGATTAEENQTGEERTTQAFKSLQANVADHEQALGRMAGAMGRLTTILGEVTAAVVTLRPLIKDLDEEVLAKFDEAFGRITSEADERIDTLASQTPAEKSQFDLDAEDDDVPF